MTVQTRPLKWPLTRVVDWADALDREDWMEELRRHLFDLYVAGFDQTNPPGERAFTQVEARESMLANKAILDRMLQMAVAPLESWQALYVPVPPVRYEDPRTLTAEMPTPFQEFPPTAWSAEEWSRWTGYVQGQLDYLTSLAFSAYPEGTRAHLRARWTSIRLRAFLQKLRVAITLNPPPR